MRNSGYKRKGSFSKIVKFSYTFLIKAGKFFNICSGSKASSLTEEHKSLNILISDIFFYSRFKFL
ncbi:MAG: hypothetical protein DDT27_01380 [Dehalococcoidia bacterium]|nr:hypothetical protein [Chloroflexota bacterium]